MSATDELRRMLTEAGVEWGNVRNDGSESDYLTEWQFDGIQSYAVATEWAVGGGLSLETHQHHLTPEQAIAATLGAGTCHDAAGKQMKFFACSVCGGTIERKHPRFCPNCGRKVVDE